MAEAPKAKDSPPPLSDPTSEEAVRARRAARLRTAAEFSTLPPPTVSASLEHGRLVRVLKVALPLVALGLVATMVIYSVLYRPDGSIAISYSGRTYEEGAIVLKNPRFAGADRDNQPFEVLASSARQDANNTALVELSEVDASMTLTSGPTLKLIARKGLFDTENRLLQLTGPLTLSSTEGYQIRTDEARADLASGFIAGQQPIEAVGAFGTIRADAFEATQAPRTIRFIGNVQIHFIPSMEQPQ